MEIKDIIEKLDIETLLSRPLPDWRPTLANECQVYVFEESYLAKRFDQINYKFCEKDEAKEILIDNLYALLRYKYFLQSTERCDKRIGEIVNSFTSNLKTTLKRVSFDDSSDAEVVKMLPDYSIAFRNGVYDFKNNTWLFKYNIVKLERLSNSIYMYDKTYIILWYMDYNFEPLSLNLNVGLNDFIKQLKTLDEKKKNYCFELMYNIAHDSDNNFDESKFMHICELLGYTCLQSFSQHFIVLVGSGQNGKNSLFDGCFINRVIPRPASNDMNTIETDHFITGALQNKSHNFFLESSPKTYTESTMLKNLTGSMYQTIHEKGVNKYSGLINCKFVFSANDQSKLKFSDNTTGLRRRINILEIFYRWDSMKRFMKFGDYYDTSFSDDLYEIKSNIDNTSVYIYAAMFGIANATFNFTKNFAFSKNDWNYKYSDIDMDTKDKVDAISAESISSFIATSNDNYELCKYLFYDLDKKVIYKSQDMIDLGYNSYPKMIQWLSNEEDFIGYFSEHYVYISVRCLQGIIRNYSSSTNFTQIIKKIYHIDTFVMLNANKPYIKCTFINGKLKILK